MLVKLEPCVAAFSSLKEHIKQSRLENNGDAEYLKFLDQMEQCTLDDFYNPINGFEEYEDCPDGIYVCSSFDHEDYLDLAGMRLREDIDQRKFVPEISQGCFDFTPRYGVCDHPMQILENCKSYNHIIDDPNRKFIITMTPVYGDSHPDWRWSKWGQYIGTQNPTHEYLKDDTHIEMVFTYHLYELEEDTNYAKK